MVDAAVDAVVNVATWKRRAWRLGVLALAAVTTVGAARSLDTRAPAPIGDEHLVYLPDAARLRPLALGYDTVLADLLWFRTISYFGAHLEGDRSYPWLEAMCNLVTDLDPRAMHAYHFAGLILPWEAHDADGGIRMLEKGIRQFPESWELHYSLGVVHYLFKHDNDTAATWLERGAALADAPLVMTRLAAVLRTGRQSGETAIAVLEQMLANTTSKRTRAVLENALLDARVALDLEILTRLVRDHRDRTGVLPTDLQVLVDAGVLRIVPPDRYGGAYVIDPATATVHSSTGREPMRTHESPIAQRLRAQTPTEDPTS